MEMITNPMLRYNYVIANTKQKMNLKITFRFGTERKGEKFTKVRIHFVTQKRTKIGAI